MTREKQTDEQRRAANWARQQRYRERHLKGLDGADPLARLNILIDADTKSAMDRISALLNVSQKVLIERLVAEAETALVDPLDEDEMEKQSAIQLNEQLNQQPDIQSLTYRVFDLIEPAIKAAIAQALQEHLES